MQSSWKQDSPICLWVSYTAFWGNLPNLNGMVEHTEIYDFTFSHVFLRKVKDEEVPWNKISLCNRAFKIPGFQSGILSERWLRVSLLVFIPLRTWFRKISLANSCWWGRGVLPWGEGLHVWLRSGWYLDTRHAVAGAGGGLTTKFSPEPWEPGASWGSEHIVFWEAAQCSLSHWSRFLKDQLLGSFSSSCIKI